MCRPRVFGRRRFPRRFRPFACRVFGISSFSGGRPRPGYKRSRPLNTCRTGWPGGYGHAAPGATLPEGEVRTGFRDGRPTNPRCYPGTGGRRDVVSLGGNLAGAIHASRQESLAAAEEDRRRALLLAPTVPGTSIEAQNAFALRFSDDVCTPFFCAFDNDSWSTSQNRNVIKGRGRLAELAAKGLRVVPLDITALRQKVGREPTSTELVVACGDAAFYIQARKSLKRTGSWMGAMPGETALEQATRIARPRLQLRPGAAPALAQAIGPAPAPGTAPPLPTVVYAAHPCGSWGATGGYTGPYIPNMEAYWEGRGGIVSGDKALVDAAFQRWRSEQARGICS